MDEITMPDFDEWGRNIYHKVTESYKSWSIGISNIYSNYHPKEDLKQAFEQGRALGAREAICSNQEWWEQIDEDKEEQQRLSELMQKEDKDILPKLIDKKHPDLVQVLNPKSGCYTVINRRLGRVIGTKCGGKPFKNIPIVGKD